MSVAISAWAWRQELPVAQKFVLVKLADSANDDGYCWPSLRTLERDLGMGRSSISRHVRALVVAGMMTVEQRKHSDGRRRSSYYHLAGRTLSHPGRDDVGGTLSHPGGTTLSHPGRDIEPSVTVSTELANARSASEPADWVPDKTYRDAVWDALVALFGEPLARGKAGRGRIVSDLCERLGADGTRIAADAAAEVARRHAALGAEWSSRATARALVEHWHVAGTLADSPTAASLSADDIARMAVRLQEEGR